MSRVLEVLVPGPGGDGSWVDAALTAVHDLPSDVDVRVRTGVPTGWSPDADVVLCHGIQYESLVRAAPPSGGQRVVWSDRPPSLAGLEHATVVDWAWREAAYVAGAVAGSSSATVGLVAGPPVLTQRRLAAAFAAGALTAAEPPQLWTVHLTSFDDELAGTLSGERLADSLGCGVVATSADAAGARAAQQARSRGATTFGFLDDDPGDLGRVRSDVTGVLRTLLTSALGGDDLPSEVVAGLASGSSSFELDDGAAPELVRVRDAATADIVTGRVLL